MIEGIKPYGCYKKTSSGYLGSIPEHWSERLLWTISTLRAERNPGGLPLLSVFLDRGVIPYGQGSGQVHAPSLDQSNYQVVCPGDFVLNNQQAWRGSVGVSHLHGVISPAYVVLELSRQLNPQYANYLLRCPRMVDQYVAASKGVGDIQRQIFWPFLRRVAVSVPPVDEQAAIVRFLDHANRRIDCYIRAKRKLIALLNEQKQAIIQRTVTRGLDSHVPMRDSGVDWIGQIPVHWRVRRIKHLLRETDRRSSTGNEMLLSLRMHHGLVPFAEHFDRPPQAATLVGFKVVASGQLVINRMQAGNGLIYASRLDGLVSPDYGVFSAIGDVSVEYVGEVFRSKVYRAKFRSESKGLGTGTSGFLRLYSDRLGSIHVAVPPREEQETILAGLVSRLSRLNELVVRLEREIAFVCEYRARLVADVVTGQLDVREAARGLSALEPEELETEPVDSDTVDGLDGTEVLEA